MLSTQEKIALYIFLFAVFLVYVLEFSLFVRLAVYKIFKREKPYRMLVTKFAIGLHVVAFLGILCMLWSYFIEPYWPDVTKHEIKTGLFDKASFRIVHITDMHCDRKVRCEKKLVSIVNNLEPDIIVYTGDAINEAAAFPLFKETLGALEAKLGKFAIKGNFEAWYWTNMDYFGGTGFRKLANESVTVEKDGEKITIAGLSFDMFELGAKPVPLPGNTFNIFLFHYPNLVEDIAGLNEEHPGIDYNANLYLCGHTHGGQIRIPFYGAMVTLSKFGKKYEMGRYEVGETILYVNRGVGMEGGWVPRVRFNCRPEIVVFDIGPGK
ncbi:MAG: metallophosphoesterase [Planctomycetota bacterium]|jgi:predicted MPP superfamily phosphohydrolase